MKRSADTSERVSNRDYIIFPISCLHRIFSDRKQALNDMLDYGVGNLTKSITMDFGTALCLTVYEHLQGRPTTNLIDHFMETYIITRDLLFNSSGEHDATALLEIWNDLTAEYDLYHTDLEVEKEKILNFGKMKTALKYLKMKQDVQGAISRSLALETSQKQVSVMLHTDLIFAFRDEEKSQFELISFCVYAAIRSIIGKNPAVKTNIEMVLQRAFGNNEELIKKYSTRRMFEKTMNELELNWHLTRYSFHTRGFYVSTSMSIKHLSYFAEARKDKNRIAKLKQDKMQARTDALMLISAEKSIGVGVNPKVLN
jgi:hypothetical protein